MKYRSTCYISLLHLPDVNLRDSWKTHSPWVCLTFELPLTPAAVYSMRWPIFFQWLLAQDEDPVWDFFSGVFWEALALSARLCSFFRFSSASLSDSSSSNVSVRPRFCSDSSSSELCGLFTDYIEGKKHTGSPFGITPHLQLRYVFCQDIGLKI